MMQVFTDIEQGRLNKFGRLTLVDGNFGKSADGHLTGRWRCDCGREVNIANTRVRNGYTRSCGCLSVETSRKHNTKHGKRNSPEYSSWRAMLDRCCNPKAKDFARYGARGITVCNAWRHSFETFYLHLGPRPQGMTLDRINTLAGYEPGNCRWATPTEQAENTTSVWIIEINGRRFPSAEEAARAHRVSTTTIHRWCDGYLDLRRAGQPSRGRVNPKAGCRKWRLYDAA